MAVLICLCGFTSSVRAACAWTGSYEGVVTSVRDYATLDVDGRLQVHLIAAEIVRPPDGNEDVAISPIARQAAAELTALVGKPVMLRYGGRKTDRYGRHLAHVFLKSGEQNWLQARLIARGLARTYSDKDNKLCIGDLLKLEQEARRTKRGLWALDRFKVITSQELRRLAKSVNSFQLVEGRVRKVSRIRRRVFINFGANWREDFTAMIAPRDVRSFTRAGIDLLALAGQVIRVRGWITLVNGPSIKVTHPEQIEIVGK